LASDLSLQSRIAQIKQLAVAARLLHDLGLLDRVAAGASKTTIASKRARLDPLASHGVALTASFAAELGCAVFPFLLNFRLSDYPLQKYVLTLPCQWAGAGSHRTQKALFRDSSTAPILMPSVSACLLCDPAHKEPSTEDIIKARVFLRRFNQRIIDHLFNACYFLEAWWL